MNNKNLIIIIGIILLVVVGGIILINYYSSNDGEDIEEPFNDSEEKYCGIDEGCVWAFNPYTCCDCPRIYNKEIVDAEDDLVIYEKGKDYSLLRTADCTEIACSPCVPITELECVDNECVKIEIEEKKYYDWNARLIICKECSPYSQEPILLNSELEELKELLIFNFDEGEIVFDSFGTNTIYINLTNEAYYKINGIIENINSDDSINTTITTVYYNRIIRQEEQKESLSEEEIYICEEDRECISVSAGCCGCSSGGQATTINEDYLDYWNNKLAEDCQEIGCIAVMSNHWTCFAEPKCVNNKCELIKESLHEECNWKPTYQDYGTCAMLIGIYYDGEKCVGLSGCSNKGDVFPFNSIEECKELCGGED